MFQNAPSEAEAVRAVAEYYAARASEYDLTAGYEDPVAEPLRTQAKVRCQESFRDRDVLEIACGTGYWTEVVAQVARSVLATDMCEGMLALARKRPAGLSNVQFQIADAYSLDGVRGDFNAAYAVWWWSHIPKRLIPRFLATLHGRLQPGAQVLFVDQLPSAYASNDQRVDANGDTTEVRHLSGGRSFRVVKNFPGRDGVMEALAGLATGIEYREFPDECSWHVSYRIAGLRQARSARTGRPNTPACLLPSRCGRLFGSSRPVWASWDSVLSKNRGRRRDIDLTPG